MSVEDKLKQLGLSLPPPRKPMATYAAAVRVGELLFVAGQGPIRDGKPTALGKVGGTVSLEQGYEAAKVSCLNALAVVKEHTGSLDAVERVVKAMVWVACIDTFTDQPKVADGATDLLKELFGEDRLPARAAVGTNVLPMDLPVELEIVVQLKR